MFGRSTSSRFSEKKDYTPGPGEYNAQAVSTTSRRGASMGIGARTLHATSEFAHLGPGAYSLGESSFTDGRRGVALRAGAVDYESAMKKLSASFAKVLGPAGGLGANRELSREDICAMAGKLIADSLAASTDAMRLKGELDGINSRVKDEVQAVLKPSKSTGNAGNPTAWKIYMPLEKAVDNSSSDLAKKLTKLSSFLTLLHEDFPALALCMADGDRIGQLSQIVEALEVDLDASRAQAADSAAAAAAAEEANAALLGELAVYKRQHMQLQVRSDKLENLLESQKDMVHSLENQMEASHAQQEALWSQLLAEAQSAAGDCTSQHTNYQNLLEQCKESQDAHDQALEELHAMQAQMTVIMSQNDSDKAMMEEQMLAADDTACCEANEMVSEIDECRALLMQSHRDKRIVRSTVTALEGKRRALKACLAGVAVELNMLHASMADNDAHAHCQASPQRLCPEALEAVSFLDKSLTDDLLAMQLQVEELTEALSKSEEQLTHAHLELTQLHQHMANHSQQAHTQGTQLASTIDGLMHSSQEAEQQLREQILEQEQIVREVQEQLVQTRTARDQEAAQVKDLSSSLALVSTQFQTYTETSSTDKEQRQQEHASEVHNMHAVAAQALMQHTAAIAEVRHKLDCANEQHRQKCAEQQDALVQTIAEYEADFMAKAQQIDEMGAELALLGTELQATREASQTRLSSVAHHVTLLLSHKRQLEDDLAQMQQRLEELEADLSSTRQSMESAQQAADEKIGYLDAELKTRSQDLAASQDRVMELGTLKEQHKQLIVQMQADAASTQEELDTRSQDLIASQDQVMELNNLKMQHEQVIAHLQAHLASTQEELKTRSQDVATSQHQVMELRKLQAQHEQVISQLHADLASTQEELAQTQQHLETRTQELAGSHGLITDLEEQLQVSQRMHKQQQAEAENKLHDAATQQALVQKTLDSTLEELAVAQSGLAAAAQLEQTLRQSLAETQSALEQSCAEASRLTEELAQESQQLAQMSAVAGERQQHIETLLEQAQEASHALEHQTTQRNNEAQTAADAAQAAAAHLMSVVQAAAEAAQAAAKELAQESQQLAQMSAVADERQQHIESLLEQAQAASHALEHQTTQRNNEAQAAAEAAQAAAANLMSVAQAAAEAAQAAAAHLTSVEEAQVTALTHKDERLAKLDDTVLRMTTQLEETKSMLHDTTERLDARSRELVAALAESDEQLTLIKQKLANTMQELSDVMHNLSDAKAAHAHELAKILAEHAAAVDTMQSHHAQDVDDMQAKLRCAQEQHAADLEAANRTSSEERQAASMHHTQTLEQHTQQAETEKMRLQEHAAAVKTELCEKMQQVEERAEELSSSLEQARAEHANASQNAETESQDAQRLLTEATSKIEMLSSALKGTEHDKALALAAISNMYEHTDQQLKAMAGANTAPVADSASLSRLATLEVCVPPAVFCSPSATAMPLTFCSIAHNGCARGATVLTQKYTQAELETSMMERSECLQQLHELQQTERQAAAEALKHRQNLETVLSEKKGLTDRLQLLETDNAKLSAENIQVSCPLLLR